MSTRDGCTCGSSANPSHQPPYQCYAAGAPGVPHGLWYRFNITDGFIREVSDTVRAYKAAHTTQLVVCYLHVGPNFQWEPYPERVQLLRNISAGADLVWGTSSHHIQRFEVYGGTPIVYGLGDFLFRHVVGVDDFCPLYARPCASFRPELSLVRTATDRPKLAHALLYAGLSSPRSTPVATDVYFQRGARSARRAAHLADQY